MNSGRPVRLYRICGSPPPSTVNIFSVAVAVSMTGARLPCEQGADRLGLKSASGFRAGMCEQENDQRQRHQQRCGEEDRERFPIRSDQLALAPEEITDKQQIDQRDDAGRLVGVEGEAEQNASKDEG